MSSWPPIPGWETNELEKLASAGSLYNVPPLDLAVIDLAESSGQGGGINPEGYGGWFGLGQSSTYPGGASSPTLLRDTSAAGFDAQAQLAASEFASLLAGAGGDPIAAEETYQSGHAGTPTEGSKLLQQYTGATPPATSGAGAPTQATDTSALSFLNPLNDLGTVFGSIADDVKTWFFVGAFTVVGAVMILVGLKGAAESATGSDNKPSKTERAAQLGALAAA